MRRRRGNFLRTWSLACALGAAAALGTSACGDDGSSDPGGEAGGGGAGGGAGTPQRLLILHTNDLHSHLVGHAPEADYTPATVDDDATVGGAARLAAAIGAARASAAASETPVLLLDAGDFMMGTLFELLATTESPELSFMQSVGYDATTLGNHELDWSPDGLAAILAAAAENGVSVPIVASNMSFSADDPGDDALEAVAEAGGIQTKLVKTVGSLRVGFFGLLGADAEQVTPQARPLDFEIVSLAARRMVTELREVDGVDLVIALSHSGIRSDGTGEDADLAEAVDGIDVIVSGHTHDSLEEPALVNGALIVTAGSYGRFLGQLELTVTPGAGEDGAARVELDGYTLLPVDDAIEGDAEVESTIEEYIGSIDEQLAPAGLAYDAVVATTEADLALPEFAEAPVGNLVADAYRSVSAALEPEEPAVIGVEANGQLRAPIAAGETGAVWFADLFRVVPIGIGPDGSPGFPLVSFYLNAEDIRAGLELGAAPEIVSNDFFLQISGLKVEHDPSQLPFGRVAALTLVTEAGELPLDPADTSTCYKVVTTNYVAGLLGVVESFTMGLLAVNAKDADCQTLVDPTTRFVDADPETDGVQELKQWQALLRYVSALPDVDADDVPNIPTLYTMPEGRIISR